VSRLTSELLDKLDSLGPLPQSAVGAQASPSVDPAIVGRHTTSAPPPPPATDEVTDGKILRAFTVLHGIASTSALAEWLDVSYDVVKGRLDALRARGLVHFEVERPGSPDGIDWRRSSRGIELSTRIR
jgi:hypothetical protein